MSRYERLEDVPWTAGDGVKRYPARGEMNHRHIRNSMRFLQSRCERTTTSYTLHQTDIWRAFLRGLELPDPGEYKDQDPNWRLGRDWEEYTIEEHMAYSDWATRRVTGGVING